MIRYIFLFFVVITGFTGGDTHQEFLELKWNNNSQIENKSNFYPLLYFENAAYPDPHSEIPVFFKIYELERGKSLNFAVENQNFEEIQLKSDYPGYNTIKNEVQITKVQKNLDGENSVQLHIIPFKKEEGKIYRLKSFTIKSTEVNQPLKEKSAQVSNTFTWKTSSVLKQGKWIKISVTEKGIYKIPFSKLASWGFSDPSKVNVFGSGGKLLSEDPGKIEYDDLEQCAVWSDKNNGTDCLFFYAPGTVEWNYDETSGTITHRLNDYSLKGYYFLTNSFSTQKTVPVLPVLQLPSTQTVTIADAVQLYEKEFENVLPLGSGKKWYGDKFQHSSVKNIEFDLPDLVTTEKVKVKVDAIARSTASSEMKVLVNSAETGSLKFRLVNTGSPTSEYASGSAGVFTVSALGSPLRLTLKFYADNFSGKYDDNALAWLDFAEINYRRKLRFGNGSIFFSDRSSVGENKVVSFNIENASTGYRLFDITDIYNLKEIPLEISSNIAVAKRKTDQLYEYAAFNPNGSYNEPEMVGEVANQNLHSISSPEFVIITNPAFKSAADRLADFHRTYDGMKVEVVTTEQVFNEFSSGEKSATGIRNFIKMLYDNSTGFKYALLFGDGSFDNRGIRAETKNFVPTYQSENSLDPIASFVTDDFFGILEAGQTVYNGDINIGIGRIPASSIYEAELVVDKIEKYHAASAFGNWRNIVCFIGDDEDGSLHMSDSEKLSNQVNASHGEFLTEKIYLDAYLQEMNAGEEKYPDVTNAINNRVKDGVLILNYVGHANERFMADEHVLDISDVNSWSNPEMFPIFVTATCEFSRFDADLKSIGEYVLFNASGGGVGLFSTTRLVFAYSNFLLSQSFYNYVFEADKQGNRYRLGDIIRLAKNNIINSINKRSFSLLADPALRLSYPENHVITSKINGVDVTNSTDTLKALEKITIEGYVANNSGNQLNNFTGQMNVTIYDKETIAETMGNNGEPPFQYKVMDNIVYKGTASVTNGKFNFSFVVPKDISYATGRGKIIYYAENGVTDAGGAFDKIYVGGQSGINISDKKGPEIDLFIDNKEFKSGGETSKNPLLIAVLSDENGINTAGTGIGHDITAVLDEDYSNVIVLNKYYQSNLNDFTSGEVKFQLNNLTPGKHTIRLKAWDVANNSAETVIEFEVTGSFYISKVINTPNPAANYTRFSFEHNQSGAILDVMIEVFDISGRKMDMIITQVGSGGTLTNPVMWDFENAQTALGNGIYVYRITAKNADGQVAVKSGKMLVHH